MDFKEDLKRSLNVLRKGGLLLYPTDTVWGIGCDATNSLAVKRISSIKSRKETKSLIILVSNKAMLDNYVKDLPETASRLIEISDSPLTIIYPAGINLADGVCSSDGSVGIRICNDPFCKELIIQLGKPLVSTSANITGQKTPLRFSEINEEIFQSVDYVVEYRQKELKLYNPSPIIKVENNGIFMILRQ